MQAATISTAQTPHELCQERLALRTAEAQQLSARLQRSVRRKRLAIYTVIGYAVFDPTAMVLLVPLFIFCIPVVVREHILGRRRQRAERAAEFHRHALARFDNHWIGDGHHGLKYLRDEEVFADDLDVFGRASLFQFLCTAQTNVGQDTLAEWLTNPATADEIQERQAAVRELSSNADLREQLAIVEADSSPVDRPAMMAWARVPELLTTRAAKLGGWGLAVAVVLVIVFGGRLPIAVSAAVIGAELALFVVLRDRLRQLSSTGRAAVGSFRYLSAVHAVLRTTSFTSQRLSEIQRTLAETEACSRLGLLLDRITAEFPPLLLPVCQLLPGVDRRRRELAQIGERGLLALGELEALDSLAHFAFVQPDATYPDVVTSETCYEATELGHPLIGAGDRVKNDVRLNDSLRLLMVSGSNMSGKSTMLRTVGINTVLALSGAPVCAGQLRISPFAIGTAMRFSDSLEHQTSYFHAVITRLRRVMDLQDEPRPLLFLIDEILQGTNSGDRIEGTKALVRRLLERGGVGMITTHDLELTRIVDTCDGLAANVHFVDQLRDGEIEFDYQMRPGVVGKGNALALMRRMGLDV